MKLKKSMISILNAAPDTGNQGINALCLSAVAGLSERDIGPIAVADHGRGRRKADWGVGTVDLFGLSNSRYFWRAENLALVRRLARIGGGFSASARVIAQSRAILDISGGDSFCDLYGQRRYQSMALTKRLALDSGKKLILLPQTLGPFKSSTTRADAVEILKAADAVWVRDPGSFRFLQDVLGAAFDSEKHRLGVDMAVALPQVAPTEGIPRKILDWMDPGRDFPLIGVNVSAFLARRAVQAQQTFGLMDRHDRQMELCCRALLGQHPGLRILLVPHVHKPEGQPNSDLSAAIALKVALGPEFAGRIEIIRSQPNAMALKWIMARLDWCLSARMHALISAFSAGTPTLGLGYSDKAAGVFEQCGLADEVADLRRLDTAALVGKALTSFGQREEMRVRLTGLVTSLRQRAKVQMDAIAAQIGN